MPSRNDEDARRSGGVDAAMDENAYRETVFLSWVADGTIRLDDVPEWARHQAMQFDFLLRRGLAPTARVLDMGCGPLRLGARLIPHLTEGWYYGQDINPRTLALGRQVLERLGVAADRCTLLCSDDFSLDGVDDHSIDVAFSNSLFSHLGAESVRRCLESVAGKLRPGGVYYSTFFAIPEDHDWRQPFPRDKWGRQFATRPDHDPFHYGVPMMEELARAAGYALAIDPDFGHPTQTMGVFRRLADA